LAQTTIAVFAALKPHHTLWSGFLAKPIFAVRLFYVVVSWREK
jgi:hypothetical protein